MYVTPHFIWHPGPAAQPGAALCCAVLSPLRWNTSSRPSPRNARHRKACGGAPGRQLKYEPPCQKLQACRWCKAERLDSKCG